MERRPKWTFLQRRHTDGQQAYEKMLNITIRKMQIKNNELPPHTSQNDYHQKSTNNKSWKGCGRKAILLHSWCECKLVQPLWKTERKFLKKLKIQLLYDQQPHSWA